MDSGAERRQGAVIRVLFFARLREQLDCASLELDWTPALSSAEALKSQLQERGKVWRDALGQENLLCAVNQVQARGEQPVADGDEVAFFPPVTGG